MAVTVGAKVRYSDLTTITTNATSYSNTHCPANNTSYTTSARYSCSYDSYNGSNDSYRSDRYQRSYNGFSYGC